MLTPGQCLTHETHSVNALSCSCHCLPMHAPLHAGTPGQLNISRIIIVTKQCVANYDIQHGALTMEHGKKKKMTSSSYLSHL